MLEDAEATLGRQLTGDEIEVIMLKMVDDYGLADLPMARYTKAKPK